jgi:hypothetical protein
LVIRRAACGLAREDAKPQAAKYIRKRVCPRGARDTTPPPEGSKRNKVFPCPSFISDCLFLAEEGGSLALSEKERG